MAELIDNLTQFTVVLLGCVWAGVLYLRRRGQAYFLLCCFYGCFTLGLVYWTLYYLLFGETPQIFYVSELVWIGGCVLLYLLQYTLSPPIPRGFRAPGALLALPVGAGLLVFYCFTGDVFSSVLRCAVMTALAWQSLRVLAFCRREGGSKAEALRPLFRAVLAFAVLENCLWISSSPWVSDTWTNPYFWIDFAVTATLFTLMPAVRKAVAA